MSEARKPKVVETVVEEQVVVETGLDENLVTIIGASTQEGGNGDFNGFYAPIKVRATLRLDQEGLDLGFHEITFYPPSGQFSDQELANLDIKIKCAGERGIVLALERFQYTIRKGKKGNGAWVRVRQDLTRNEKGEVISARSHGVKLDPNQEQYISQKAEDIGLVKPATLVAQAVTA